MAGRIRLRAIVRVVAVMGMSLGLLWGAYWWGIESGGPTPEPVAAPGRVARPSTPGTRPDREGGEAILRELITREMSLRQEGLTDWEKVNRIRDWAHANIDVSTWSYLLDRDPSFAFHTRSAAEIFAAFFQDQGGVWCGGASYALMQLYRLFGFQASTLDSGKPEVMTHVVTLVQITFNGARKTLIEDPLFNVTYVTKDGTPVDYFDFLTALIRHERGRIRMLHGTRGGGDALVFPGDETLPYPFDHVVDFRARPVQVLPNGVRKYKSRISWETFQHRFGKGIYAFLRGEGHPADMLYLFLYPLGGSDRSILDKARRLTGSK